jgi:hypothetical protein
MNILRVLKKWRGCQMKSYKGFKKDMSCRGFQYEEGKEYEETQAMCCKRGFHACEYPLDVFEYYPPNTSVYHEVEQEGVIDKEPTKIASSKIKIGASIDIAGLIKAAISYTYERINIEKKATGDCGVSSATGDYGASSATGDCGASSATGYRGASSATGDCGVSSATGDYGASSATGYCGASSATGDYGVSSATGDYGASSATGNCGASSATGYRGASSATGYRGVSSATGDCGASSATGYRGASSATGDYGASSATGNCGASSATGDYGASSATGDYGASSATGNCGASSATGYRGASSVQHKNAIAIGWGYKARAKGIKGSYLVLSDWNNESGEWILKGAQMVQVDGYKIKEETWYRLENGVVREETSDES